MILVETGSYSNDKLAYEKLICNEAYKSLCKNLEKLCENSEANSANSGKFQFKPGLEKSPWRIIVLRMPLYNVLKGSEKEEDQVKFIKNAIIDGIELLNKGGISQLIANI